MTGSPVPLIPGRLIVLSGPSGVGKTTLCSRIVSMREDIKYSISATSRPRRQGEKNGREYFFLSKREFAKWIEQNRFIEYAEVHGHLYGTPRCFLEQTMEQGLHVIMDVDVLGARILMQRYPYPFGLYFFIIPPDIAELERRLLLRNTDANSEIKYRLAKAQEELRYKEDYQFIIENKDLEKTLEQVLAMIDQETEKGSRS
ncbi:guanylate kinase [candidate division WOR-3 bacterium]|nr:guanylate kinase [candidate division WOR-3 bacterium]